MAYEYDGKTIETDEEGYITDISLWTRELAIKIAEEENIEMDDDHWEVALPFEDNDSMLLKSISKQKSYPRESLLHAIILFVTENLNSSGSSD